MPLTPAGYMDVAPAGQEHSQGPSTELVADGEVAEEAQHRVPEISVIVRQGTQWPREWRRE